MSVWLASWWLSSSPWVLGTIGWRSSTLTWAQYLCSSLHSLRSLESFTSMEWESNLLSILSSSQSVFVFIPLFETCSLCWQFQWRHLLHDWEEAQHLLEAVLDCDQSSDAPGGLYRICGSSSKETPLVLNMEPRLCKQLHYSLNVTFVLKWKLNIFLPTWF